jgi:hypothetical protein
MLTPLALFQIVSQKIMHWLLGKRSITSASEKSGTSTYQHCLKVIVEQMGYAVPELLVSFRIPVA